MAGRERHARAGRGLTRRALLGGGAGALGWLALGAGARAAGASSGFAHGVASGDPLADRVVLWTRLSLPPQRVGASVPLRWRIARDPALREPVALGEVVATPDADHCVHVDAAGLAPGTTYFYAFEADGASSPIGRTRTLPAAGVERVRLAVVSCSNLPQGFFNAYARVAARADLDAVLHLGDYLYEYENGRYGDGTRLGRVPEPDREITTLADYRTRFAQYRRDPDLQELHRQHPMIAVWDDHESANNAWRDGAENHQPAREGAWPARRAAAERAWREWMPARVAGAPGALAIERRFRFGDLADLAMLDTRLTGRDEQAPRDDATRLSDPVRSLLGAAQEAWLLTGLDAAARDGVVWRLVGQQVVFAPLARPGVPPNPDAWDGYAPARERILAHLEQRGLRDVVVLTGDVHSSWGIDVPRRAFAPGGYDARDGRGSLAVELVTPAISSSPLGSAPALREKYTFSSATHPHVRFQDLDARGYLLVDLDRERAQAEWWFVDTVDERGGGERLGRALRTRRGANHLEDAAGASPAKPDAPPLAP